MKTNFLLKTNFLFKTNFLLKTKIIKRQIPATRASMRCKTTPIKIYDQQQIVQSKTALTSQELQVQHPLQTTMIEIRSSPFTEHDESQDYKI